MKYNYKIIVLFFVFLFGMQSCTDNNDTLYIPAELQIHNFIWKGLNQYYLWQANVPDLADDRFDNQNQLNDFLYTNGTPENLFQQLLFKPVSLFPANGEAVDRFSVLVNDYTYLENLFQGITTNNGVVFKIVRKSIGSPELFGWVKYVIPNSDAASKNIHRGDVFYAVNGIDLNESNYKSLLQNTNYTLNLADYNNGLITPNGISVDLTKTQLTENPILYSQIITLGSHKVAYLVYNGFTSNFDNQLNTVFGQFLAGGATHLILDLRYNPGGSIRTATRLASMITGQFNGQLFAKQQWNNKLQSFYEAHNPNALVNNFTNTVDNGVAINSLNLSKVYVLTSKSTASASELVINGLKPYINVIQIGDVTIGKNVGSITLYDSMDFSASNRNPNHKYAMQPLVIKTINKAGFGDYQNGLAPTISLIEDIGNLNQLGNINEPLLSAALGHITANGRVMKENPMKTFENFMDSKAMEPFSSEMHFEIPKGSEKVLKFIK